MLTWGQGILLAILQGLTELFPISSLGHTVILPAILGWGNVQSEDTFVPFVVMLHLGTAGALLVFYWQQWVAIVRAFVTSATRGRLSNTPDERLAWLLFFGTIPAGLLGFLFENLVKHLFGTPLLAAGFLIVNGGIMLFTERLRRREAADPLAVASASAGAPMLAAAHRATETPSQMSAATLEAEPEVTDPLAATSHGRRTIQDLSWLDAVVIGTAQALALFPGISRSGITMCAALLRGMRHDEAAEYTFLLATPIIAAAGVLEVPVLFGASGQMLAIAVVGALLAGVTAYLSVRFLTRYFRVGNLVPFAIYCVLAGLFTLGWVGLGMGIRGA